jgi:hypothetical protein
MSLNYSKNKKTTSHFHFYNHSSTLILYPNKGTQACPSKSTSPK